MITVLMSTYNGEKYVKEQMESIINQDIGFNNIKLIIRDDSSNDKTYSILKAYEKEYSNISIIRGENLGAALSFWDLLKKVENKNEYYAFADQDDIWLPNKLSVAIERLKRYNDPALYYCNGLYVDKIGNSLNRNVIRKPNHHSVPTIMAGLPALGCTMVFNMKALVVFKNAKLTGIEMHDRSCLLIMYLVGRVIYDENIYLKYRQHENNVIGSAEQKSWSHRKKRFKQSYKLWFKSGKHSAVVQANDMLNNYNKILRDEDYRYLKLIASYRRKPFRKWKLLNSRNISYLSKGTRKSYKLRILLNIF